MPGPIESLRLVSARLEPLKVPYVFLGGAAICLLVDRPELSEIRPTKDVDVVVEAVTLGEFYALEELLRAASFQHDVSEGAPICRWVVDGCRVDIMPAAGVPLGMNSKWFPEALLLSRPVNLGDGRMARVVTPPLFLATKLEAFKDRGRGDFYGSHDIEDIVTVIDGCEGIIGEVESAPGEIRRFVAASLTRFLQEPDFCDAFPGHLSGLTGARQRASMLRERLAALAALA